MSSTSYTDSSRAVVRSVGGQDYRFTPTYIRNRDPITPATSPDIRPKEQQGRYPINSLWSNTSNGNVWLLLKYNNDGGTNKDNTALWVLISTNSVGPLIEIGVPNGTSPILPDVNGLINFTSTGGTVIITGSAGGTGAQNINFDITGGSIAIEKILVDHADAPGTNPVLPTASQISLLGATVLAQSIPIRTESDAASTIHIQAQLTTTSTSASKTIDNAGLASFNSADFTVDSATGFVSAFNSFVYTNVTHDGTNPSPYTVSATDYYISCDTTSSTAGTITIKLPDAPTTFRKFIIKDRTGGASANNISITTVGGAVTIDGETTYTLAGNFGSIQLLFNGTSYEVF